MRPHLTEDDVQWVVNDLGELGICVHGQYFFCYKGGSLQYGSNCDEIKDGFVIHHDGSPMMVRPIGKREFGEVVKPVIFLRVGSDGLIHDETPFPYRETLAFYPGISHGHPEEYMWRPLPAP